MSDGIEREGNLENESEPRESSSGSIGGRRFGLLEVIVAVVTYLVAQIAGGGVLAALYGPEALLSPDSTTTLWLVLISAASAFAAAFLANALRVRALAGLGLVSTSGRWLLIGAAVGLLAYLVNRVVVILYVWISGDTSNPQQGLADTAIGGSVEQFALLILLGGLVVPLGEELLFRGVLFGWLRRWGFVLAAIISSIIFGLAHGINVVLPAAIILGFMNAYLYERSGSIWPPAVSHAVNNVAVFAVARVLVELGVPIQ